MTISSADTATIRAGAQAAQDLGHLVSQYPLAVARLWVPHCTRWNLDKERPRGCGHRMVSAGTPGVYVCHTAGCEMLDVPEIRTCQREAIQALMTPGLVALLLGGANRAGKTSSAIQWAVARAAGSDEPWVREWLTGNGMPIDMIQPGPGTVVVSALTHKDSREYHRDKLDEYLPVGTKRRMWRADDEAEAIMPNGGRILCKAAAQGRKAFQGTAIVGAVLDEEHPEDVYEEVMRGCAELDAPILLPMTPLNGLTWTYKIFIAEPREGHLHRSIYGLDNPHVSSRALIKRFKHFNPEKRDARLYGKYASAKGLIYPSFSRQVHVIKPYDLDPKLLRWRSIDFGYWFGCVWAAYEPDRDQIVVYIANKTEGLHISANGRQIKNLSKLEEYKATFADPADKKGREELADMGIKTKKARKDVEAGINTVCEALALTAQGYPRLVIFDTCKALILELEQYRRDKNGNVKKTNDHLADCLRYLLYTRKRGSLSFAVA